MLEKSRSSFTGPRDLWQTGKHTWLNGNSCGKLDCSYNPLFNVGRTPVAEVMIEIYFCQPQPYFWYGCGKNLVRKR